MVKSKVWGHGLEQEKEGYFSVGFEKEWQWLLVWEGGLLQVGRRRRRRWRQRHEWNLKLNGVGDLKENERQ